MDAQKVIEFDDVDRGKDLRDQGINQAIEHANEVHQEWSEMAFDYLKKFLIKQGGEPFLTEELRISAYENRIPMPPSDRAWGGIVVRAAKSGLIARVGFRNVNNHKAHCTPASLWKKV